MERSQILKVMVPVGGFGLLLLIVSVVVAMNSGGGTPTTANLTAPPDGNSPSKDMPLPSSPPQPAPDLSFGLDNPEWKDVGGGLKIWDVKEGTGAVCPTIDERPSLVPIMHYTGWLTTGTVFDSSKPKGQPLTLPLRQLIPGWKQGVPGMKVGGVRRLLIPSDLGYGQRGSPPTIPGGATLFFEMELLDVR